MNLPLYQVDAFTSKTFGGNPAAVVPLDEWLPDDLLQSIALENNLSETAYFVQKGDHFELRWFTPAIEVDLCGHATLASAFVLFEEMGTTGGSIRFETRKAGSLNVAKEGDLLVMDFPSRPPEPTSCTEDLVVALNAEPQEVYTSSRDLLAVFENEDDIRALEPDFAKLDALDAFAVIATAPGKVADFVSRFFAPKAGVPEDPVTGSAHCTLTPYWSRRLDKAKLHAFQLSRRVGELFCEDRGDRVSIKGRAVLFLKGEITTG